MTRLLRSSLIALGALLSLASIIALRNGVALSQDERPPPQQRHTPAAERRERQTLAFVQEQHPELAELLAQLKTASPDEYADAIRELAQLKARLDQLEAKNVDRYELELQLWRAKSDVQILAARSAMTGDSALHDDLRAAVARQLDVRLAIMEFERDAAIARAKTLTDNIEKLKKSRERQIERQLESLEEGIAQSRKSSKDSDASKKPGRKSAKTTSDNE